MSEDEKIIPPAIPQPLPQPQTQALPIPQPQAIAQPQSHPQPLPASPQQPIANTPQPIQPAEPETVPMATAETPVTGQTRMETAWGSSEGDEDFSEMASIGQTGAGEIFETKDNIYKRYDK